MHRAGARRPASDPCRGARRRPGLLILSTPCEPPVPGRRPAAAGPTAACVALPVLSPAEDVRYVAAAHPPGLRGRRRALTAAPVPDQRRRTDVPLERPEVDVGVGEGAAGPVRRVLRQPHDQGRSVGRREPLEPDDVPSVAEPEDPDAAPRRVLPGDEAARGQFHRLGAGSCRGGPLRRLRSAGRWGLVDPLVVEQLRGWNQISVTATGAARTPAPSQSHARYRRPSRRGRDGNAVGADEGAVPGRNPGSRHASVVRRGSPASPHPGGVVNRRRRRRRTAPAPRPGRRRAAPGECAGPASRSRPRPGRTPPRRAGRG